MGQFLGALKLTHPAQWLRVTASFAAKVIFGHREIPLRSLSGAATRLQRLLIFLLVLGSLATAQTSVGPPRTIRVVVDNAYAPYSFQSDDGRLQGILIDEWQAWEKQTGCKAELYAMDWGEALRRMRAGEFDVIDSIFETPERDQYFDFTPPYATIEASIYFRRDISGITDLTSLKGFPIGVKTGDQHIDKLKANGVTTVIPFQNNEAIIEAAKEHKINVFLADDPSALYLLNKAGIEDDFRHSAPVFHDELRRAVRKGDEATLRMVSAGFAAINASELKQIDEKWFGRTINRYGIYLTYAAYAAAVAILLIMGLLAWNSILRKRVLQRTALLYAKDQEFRAIVENAPDQIIRYDKEFRQAYVNPAVAKAYGLPREALIGKPIGSVIKDTGLVVKEDELTQLRQRIANVFDSGQSYEYELNWPLPQGRRYFSVRLFPELDLKGSVVNVLGISRDITERKQAEDALRRNEDQLRLVLDTTPALIHTGRPDGYLDYFNQPWLNYVGRSLGELQGWGWTASIHPGDVEGMVNEWRMSLASGEPFHYEARVRQADGEYRRMLHRKVGLRDEHGNIVKWHGSSIDIEGSKQAEEALAERLRFETLLTELSAAFANLSPHEVGHEIDRWLQTLVEFLGVDRASFLQFEEDWATVVRTHSYTVPGIEPLPPAPIRLNVDFPWITDQLRRGVTVKWSRIPDDMPEEAVKERKFATKLGLKSGLNIPVRVGGAVIGAITFTSVGTYRDWPDATVARLRLVGEIFAAAVERKRADALLRREKETLEKIFDNIPVMIGFVSEDAVKFVNPEWERTIGWTLKELQEQNVDIFAEAYPDPSYRQKVLDFVAAATGAWMDLKIKVRDGRVIVAACAVVRLSDGTKVAIAQDITERKSAEERMRATSDQLRALSARLQSAREEEGTRIAREIHDELGATLTSLKWDLEELKKTLFEPIEQSRLAAVREKLSAMTKLTDLSVGTLRRIASELRPSVLDDLGLAVAIEWQAQQFQTRTGIICNCDCSLEDIELSTEQATAVFRIFQEALTNILRHAQATRVDIKISKEKSQLTLSVSDNGKGIKRGEISGTESLGLLGMRERAHLVGGDVEIKGREGNGTVVVVRVPLFGPEKSLKMTR